MTTKKNAVSSLLADFHLKCYSQYLEPYSFYYYSILLSYQLLLLLLLHLSRETICVMTNMSICRSQKNSLKPKKFSKTPKFL